MDHLKRYYIAVMIHRILIKFYSVRPKYIIFSSFFYKSPVKDLSNFQSDRIWFSLQ